MKILFKQNSFEKFCSKGILYEEKAFKVKRMNKRYEQKTK